jgi:hypothetical protein
VKNKEVEIMKITQGLSFVLSAIKSILIIPKLYA